MPRSASSSEFATTHRPERMLRLPTVIDITGRSRSSIFRDVESGKFPKPVHIGPNAIAFLQSEIANWVEQRIQESRALAEVRYGRR
jgi:prophage regulatory protein